MKTIRYLILIAVLAAVSGGLNASEVAEKFAATSPNMASGNVDERKEAQQEWQNFCLSLGPDRRRCLEACELMVRAVDKEETPVETKVWLIRQLGWIGGPEVVPQLAACLKDPEIRIRDEAARSLANIPGEQSDVALRSVDTPLTGDAVKEKHLDRDILKNVGDEKAMPMAIPYTDAVVVEAWMSDYDKLDDLKKAQTLAGLTVRRDKKYLPQALAALKSDDPTLRNAGIFAVEVLGGKGEIPALLERTQDEKSREAARLVLTRMVDQGFDEALLAQLKAARDPDRFEMIGDILSQRYNVAVRPILLERALQADCPNRLGLLRCAENLSSKDDVGTFVDVWALITDRGRRDQAEQIIARLVEGDAEPVLKKRTPENYAALFSLLGRIGSETTLREIRNRVFQRPLDEGMTASPELTAAALRAMCNWPDGRVAEDLLAVAGSSDFSDADRIQALRGFARVASLPADRIRIKIGDKEKVELLAKGMALASRVDEKRLIIQRVGQIRCVESLKFVLRYFDDPELREQVCRSIVDLAHHTDLRRSDKDAFVAALEKVIAVIKDQGLVDRAKRYKDNM